MSSIGYWEEFAEVYGGQVMYFTKKVSEEEKGAYQEIKDETDNAVKSFLQSELKRKSSFQKKVFTSLSILPFFTKSSSLLPTNLIYNLTQYRQTLLNSLFTPKLYILYRCSKSYLG